MYTVWLGAPFSMMNLVGLDLSLTTAIGIIAVAFGTCGLLALMLVKMSARRRSRARTQVEPVAERMPGTPAGFNTASEVELAPPDAPARVLEPGRDVVASVPTAPLHDRSEWRVGGGTQSRPITAAVRDFANADTGPLTGIAVASRLAGDEDGPIAHDDNLIAPQDDYPSLAAMSEPPQAVTLAAEREYERGVELLTTSAGAEQPLRDALTHFRRAQEFWTREQAPERWAIVQNEIGRVYQELPVSDRATSLRTAIMYYQSSLEIFDPVRHAMNWAWTQSALGAIYQALPSGSPIANARAAVAYHERALDVFTRENAPLAWAWNQNNLGAALETMRGGEQGERVAQLRTAAACYEAALRVYTTRDHPAYRDVVARNLARVRHELDVLE